MNSYVFLLRFDGIPPATRIGVDAFMPLKAAKLGETALKVAQRIDPNYGKSEASAIAGMKVRAMHDGACYDKPLVLHSEQDLDRDDVESYLQSLAMMGDLETFIKNNELR